MKPNDLLRDLNDPTWREKEQAYYAKLIDAVPTVKQSLQVQTMTTQTAESLAAEMQRYGVVTMNCWATDGAAMLRSQAAEIERLTLDAERYRFLVSDAYDGWYPAYYDGYGKDRHEFVFCSSITDIDKAIDAARAALETGK